MSTIDKMLIKGIRSFSPDNRTVIEFLKPLTLIVGPNGAGKTTIIESLKHACTGEMPPNAKSGHTFIHDPKVAGETETKGQIKLRFKTVGGKDVVIIRSFQLTQKPSKLEFKAIESVLQTIDPRTGEKVCLSYRCADMDREVPMLMGVSKAVLENVIFVHQDDANWPLADAATLKKKFDDIFAATKYTKALEALKKLTKEQSQLIREYKLKLDHLRTLKDQAFKLQQDAEHDRKLSANLVAKINALQQQVAEKEGQMSALRESMRQLQQIGEAIKVKEEKRAMLIRQKLEQALGLVEESTDTTEELQQWTEQFSEKVKILDAQVGNNSTKLNGIRMELEGEKENHNKRCKTQGRLQAEAEAHASNKAERNRFIEGMATRHGMALQRPLTDESAAAFVARAQHHVTSLEANLQEKKGSNKIGDDSLSKRLEEATLRYKQSESNAELKAKQLEKSRKEVEELGAKIQAGAQAESALQTALKEEEQKRRESQSRAEALHNSGLDKQIQDWSRELVVIRDKMSGLQREKDDLNSETGERVQLRLRKDALKEKEEMVEKLMDDEVPKFNKYLKDRTPKPHDLKREVKAVMEGLRLQTAEAKKQAEEAARKVAVLEDRKRHAEATLKEKTRSLDQRKSFISGRLRRLREGVEEDPSLTRYPELAEAAEKSALDARRAADTAEAMQKLLEPFSEQARVTHRCPTCDRSFTKKEEVEFVRKQADAMGHTGNMVATMTENMRRAEVVARDFKALEEDWLAYSSLDKEVPEARKKVEAIEEECAVAREAGDDAACGAAALEAELREVQKLEGHADAVERGVRDADMMRKLVADLEYRLGALSQARRSMEQVNEELEALDNDRVVHEHSITKATEKLDRLKAAVYQSGAWWNEAQKEVLKAKMEADRLVAYRKRKEEVEGLVAALEREIMALKQSLEPLEQTRAALHEQREEFRAKCHEEEGALDARRRLLQRDADQLRALQAKLSQYMMSDREDQLKKATAEIAGSLSRQRALESECARLSQALEVDKSALTDQKEIKRNIDDNLALRKTVREEQEVVAELQELQQRLQSVGDPLVLARQAEHAQHESHDIRDEKNRLCGMVSTYDANIANYKKQLKEPQYREIEDRYSNQLIQLKTTEMANKDLDKYYQALDKALMRFHSLKMEEINKTIKELWQQTYRNQDIDSIEIRSDAEGGSNSRSYSYRVVMRNGDAELDMRGRCSAGQKVLASLIIRLALAETFCLNCGILALDEPTTNLDAPNSESLAAALCRIMEDRKNQANFQLIVITHDERFAQLIGQRQHAERYYRISKNEHQHSKIEVQEIFD